MVVLACRLTLVWLAQITEQAWSCLLRQSSVCYALAADHTVRCGVWCWLKCRAELVCTCCRNLDLNVLDSGSLPTNLFANLTQLQSLYVFGCAVGAVLSVSSVCLVWYRSMREMGMIGIDASLLAGVPNLITLYVHLLLWIE